MPEIEQCHCKIETSSFKTTNIHFKIVTKTSIDSYVSVDCNFRNSWGEG